MEYAELLAGRRSTRRFDTGPRRPRRACWSGCWPRRWPCPTPGNTYDWRGVVLRRRDRDPDRWPAVYSALLEQSYVEEAAVLVAYAVQPGWWAEQYRANVATLVERGLIDPARHQVLLEMVDAGLGDPKALTTGLIGEAMMGVAAGDAGRHRRRPRRHGDRLPARRAGRGARAARRRRPVPVGILALGWPAGAGDGQRGVRPERRSPAVGRHVLLGSAGAGASHVAGRMTGGLRDELAELVAARGLSLLDAWLGPVETKLEILAVLAAGRNLLLEGPVGSGKTLLGESIAAALPPIRLAGCHFNCLPGEAACPQCRAGLVASGEIELSGTERFVRVQGSPDLFPEDLVGDVDPAAALAHGALDPRAFRPGRLVRAHRKLCFVDEVNRLSERLQNLFLELLAERALTIGGYEARFPVDTVVVATMNPDEYVGVGRLSEALRDRFERVRLDYPNPADEVSILLAGTGLPADAGDDTRQLAEAVVGFANQLRAEPEVEAGPSVRATLAVVRAGPGLAAASTASPTGAQAALAGLRVALRGRLSLRPTHRLASRPEDLRRGRAGGAVVVTPSLRV